jgi:integrase
MKSEGNAPRRVHIERGIYFRDTQAGRRYEIVFTDSNGRQRWKVVSGGLREARAARAEVVAKLARGERVAPSRFTLQEIAGTWLGSQTHLRPRTLDRYETVLRLHVMPRLGRQRASSICEDDVVSLMAQMRTQGLSGATIRKTVMVLGRVLGHATRRGLIPANPVSRLERGERPAVERREMRFLERGEMAALLHAVSDTYRPLLATAIFTGLRLGELLGLTWAEIDFTSGVIHVRKQLDRDGQRLDPKTPAAIRDVVMMPTLSRVVKNHKEAAFARGLAKPGDFVFTSRVGGPMHYRNVSRRGLDTAAKLAGLNGNGRPRFRFHDLRHTFASLLIAEGANVVFVSRQLGHASPEVTLRVYAHLFDQAAHADRARAALEASFGRMLGGSRL